MRATLALLATAAAGCDVVFGLKDPPRDAPSPGPDAFVTQVTGTYAHDRLSMNGSGDVIATPIALAGSQPPIAHLLDGTALSPVAWDDDVGAFSFGRPPDARFGISFTANTETQTQEPLLTFDTISLGRSGQHAPGVNASVNVTLSGMQPTATYTRLVSAGVWTNTVCSGSGPACYYNPTTGQVAVLHWTDVTFLPGQEPAVVDPAMDDAFYLLGYDANAMYDYLVWNAPLTATMNGDANTFYDEVSETALTANPQCVTVHAPRLGELDRLAGMFGQPGHAIATWSIAAAPSVAHGMIAAYELATRTDVDTAIGNVSLNAYFPDARNLFTHATTLVQMAVSAAYFVHGVTLSDSLIYYSSVAPTAGCTDGPMLAGAPIASVVTLQGKALTGESTVSLPDSGATAAWTVDAPGAAPQIYVAQVQHLDASDPQPVKYSVVTAEPTATFPASVFADNTDYAIRIETRTGYPGAVGGDYAQRSMPVTVGIMFSAPFRVTRP